MKEKKPIVKTISPFLVAMGLLLGGCASVPKESVALSQEVGKGIAESQRSYTALLNVYFAGKRQQVDQWIELEYLPEYLANAQAGLKKAGLSSNLTPQQLRDVLKDVMTERDQKQKDLEDTRLLLLTKSNEHYALLAQGNAGVTGLLQSMVDVKEATATSSQIIKTTSDGKIDLELLDKKFDEYLKKTGAAANKATSLYEKIKAAIEKKGS